MKLDYEIIIPSRLRHDRIKQVLDLFPSAVLFVHESEQKKYKASVGNTEVRTHKTAGIGAVRKEIILRSKADCVVMMDDDISGVLFTSGDGGKYQKIKNPDHILVIIENLMATAKDLGVTLFGWNREHRLQFFKPTEPFRVVYPCSTAFGVIGKTCVPDERMFVVGDIDITMQALVESRIILSDMRYYFDNGQVGKGAGGCQSFRTRELENEETKMLYKKWSDYAYRGPSKTAGKKGGMSMSIRVQRKNDLAATR